MIVSPKVGTRNDDGRQKKMHLNILNREQSTFRVINKTNIFPVHNRLYVCFEITCQFDFIESLRPSIKTGVKVLSSVYISNQ